MIESILLLAARYLAESARASRLREKIRSYRKMPSLFIGGDSYVARKKEKLETVIRVLESDRKAIVLLYSALSERDKDTVRIIEPRVTEITDENDYFVVFLKKDGSLSKIGTPTPEEVEMAAKELEEMGYEVKAVYDRKESKLLVGDITVDEMTKLMVEEDGE
jgi:hypothetical protein